MKLANKTVEITAQDIRIIRDQMIDKHLSKGAAIRALFVEGLDVKTISKELGIIYNHCYNVIQNEVLVHGLEVEKTGRGSGNTKKAEVLALLESGKTVREVSEELRMLYNSVWSIAKAAGLTNKQKSETTAPAEPKAKRSKKTEEVV